MHIPNRKPCISHYSYIETSCTVCVCVCVCVWVLSKSKIIILFITIYFSSSCAKNCCLTAFFCSIRSQRCWWVRLQAGDGSCAASLYAKGYRADRSQCQRCVCVCVCVSDSPTALREVYLLSPTALWLLCGCGRPGPNGPWEELLRWYCSGGRGAEIKMASPGHAALIHLSVFRVSNLRRRGNVSRSSLGVFEVMGFLSHTHKHTHIYTHTRTHTHTPTHTHIHPHTHIYTPPHTHTNKHTHIHTDTHTHT